MINLGKLRFGQKLQFQWVLQKIIKQRSMMKTVKSTTVGIWYPEWDLNDEEEAWIQRLEGTKSVPKSKHNKFKGSEGGNLLACFSDRKKESEWLWFSESCWAWKELRSQRQAGTQPGHACSPFRKIGYYSHCNRRTLEDFKHGKDMFALAL